MKQLSDEVARRYGLSAEDAQKALAASTVPEGFADEILPQFRSEAANQVNRMIQFFFAATSFNRVHRVWLAGGGGNLIGLADEITQMTGVPAKVANPFEHARVGKGVDVEYLKSMGPSFLTAFGLAMRGD